jgi:cell division protein FtsQ
MNLVADAVFLLAFVLLGITAMVALQRLPVFPLRQVVVLSELKQVSPQQLEDAGARALAGNFFTVDIHAAQAAFANVPWVRQVDLRRRWPDTIEIRIEEHQSVARWGEDTKEPWLVNRDGVVFAAAAERTLPLFVGPEHSAPRMLERYLELNRELAAIDRSVTSLQLSSRDAWRLRLDDGTNVDLGRDHQGQALQQRLARLIEAYPQLRQRALAFNTIDMRYPNGLVVRQEARS